jgi:hypothetical protein
VAALVSCAFTTEDFDWTASAVPKPSACTHRECATSVFGTAAASIARADQDVTTSASRVFATSACSRCKDDVSTGTAKCGSKSSLDLDRATVATITTADQHTDSAASTLAIGTLASSTCLQQQGTGTATSWCITSQYGYSAATALTATICRLQKNLTASAKLGTPAAHTNLATNIL